MADDNIIDLGKNFKSMVELRKYAEAQYNTINALTKKIASLEEETSHLKSLLAGANVPMISEPTSLDVSSLISNEQLICEIQINLLKNKATQSELSYEEAKKLEIYTKVLKELASRPKPSVSVPGKTLTDEELLKLVESKSE